MKKLLIAGITAFLTLNTAFSAEIKTVQPEKPGKYELGQYNFNFSDKNSVTTEQKKEETTKKIESTEETKNVNSIPVKENKPANKTFSTHKEIINQIKKEEQEKALQQVNEQQKKEQVNEEKTLKQINVRKQPAQTKTEQVQQNKQPETNTEKQVKPTGNEINLLNNSQKNLSDAINKTDKEQKNEMKKINDSIQQSQIKNSKKLDKNKKIDKDQPPFKFMIVPVQYDGSSSKSTIEKL